MDVRHLRDSARNLRIDADRKHKDAAKAADKAIDYGQQNDGSRAQAAQSDATKLNDQAAELEARAIAMDSEASNKEKRIAEIEQRQAELESDFRRQMDDLEKEKQNLIGVSPTSLLF